MAWGRMDDKFHRNRKVRELRRSKGGKEALGDWAFWWSWCLDDPDLTGIVPLDELSGSDLKSAELLVKSGLWDRVDGGYKFHDFHEYNPTRKKIEDKRDADRKRIASKKQVQPPAVDDSDSQPNRTRVANDSPVDSKRLVSDSHPRDAHARPNPTQPNPEEEERAAAVRGRAWLSNACGRDDFDHRGKWEHALAEISRKPDAERLSAANALIRGFESKVLDRKRTNPQHILDYWSTYSSGSTPRDKAANDTVPAAYHREVEL